MVANWWMSSRGLVIRYPVLVSKRYDGSEKTEEATETRTDVQMMNTNCNNYGTVLLLIIVFLEPPITFLDSFYRTKGGTKTNRDWKHKEIKNLQNYRYCVRPSVPNSIGILQMEHRCHRQVRSPDELGMDLKWEMGKVPQSFRQKIGKMFRRTLEKERNRLLKVLGRHF